MTLRLLAAAAAICLAPLAARAADDDNPYKNAKVGDYATYKVNTKVAGNNVGGTVTQTVTAKSEKEATVKATGKFNVMGMDIDIPATEQKIDLTKPYDPTKVGAGLPAGTDIKVEKGKEGKEKLKIGGKEYETTWTTYTVKGKAMGQDVDAEMKAWMSKDVSMGMVKMEMTASAAGQKIEMTMELTETGNKKP
jgi:hypothetical protein